MIIYYDPMEEPTENPTKEFLKNIIYNKDADYWKKGSGDSCIEVDGCDERLIFFYDEPHGFFVMRHPDYLVMHDESVEIETVEHRVGGEPMQVPSCSYVSREKAYEIITTFVELKRVPDFVSWMDLYDIDFEYEF
ncbi:MAG: hypothetical protein IJ379_03130 [Lachnospiraceae bacterium]|nr:hypothetical protein [Lachnospiraceae bacterium]